MPEGRASVSWPDRSTGDDPGDIARARVIARLTEKRNLLRAHNPAHQSIRTGLIVTGGGMRAAFSAGALQALEHLGLTEAFDHVIGASAGAVNAAYFAARQAERGASLYYDVLAKSRFVRLHRVWKILDVDYLDIALRHRCPLDVTALGRSRSRLYACLTDIETAGCRPMRLPDADIDTIVALRASCAAPIYYHRHLHIGSRGYADGEVGCGLPWRWAVETLGCTDLLILLNVPLVRTGIPPSLLETIACQVLCRGQYSRAFRHAFMTRHESFAQAISTADKEARQDGGLNIAFVAPQAESLTRLDQDQGLLRAVAHEGVQSTLQMFGV